MKRSGQLLVDTRRFIATRSGSSLLVLLAVAAAAVLVNHSAGEELVNTAYLLDVDMGPEWRTSLHLANLENQEISIAFTARNSAGAVLVNGSAERHIEAGATLTVKPEGPSPSINGTLKIDSHSRYDAAVLLQRFDGNGLEAIPGIRHPSGDLVFPVLFAGESKSRKFTILNVDSTPANLEIVVLSFDGAELQRSPLPALSPMASQTYNVEHLFKPATLDTAGAIRVLSNNALVGLQIVESAQADIAALPALTVGSRSWRLPVKSNDDAREWLTSVAVFNPGRTAAFVAVEAFSRGGSSLGIINQGAIAPGATHRLDSGDQSIAPEAAHFKVTADQPVYAWETFCTPDMGGFTAARGLPAEETERGLELIESRLGRAIAAAFLVRTPGGPLKPVIAAADTAGLRHALAIDHVPSPLPAAPLIMEHYSAGPFVTADMSQVNDSPPLPPQSPHRARAADRAPMRGTTVNQDVSNRVAASLSIRQHNTLKERDGIFAYRGGRYAVTLGRGFITVEDSGWLEGLGHAAVAYRLSEVRAGEAVIAVGNAGRSPVARTGDRTVSYLHGDVEERYRLDSDVLEQEFVIRTLPSSRGAITVTGRISTNLTAPADASGGAALSFTHQGREMLSFSKAVAIDASGRTLPLEMVYAGDRLSITIPAAWVAEASLPITLDPVIGAPITVDSSLQSANYQVSDISFNAARHTWLVIWNEWAGSTFGNNVYGQIVDSAGNLVGGQLQIGAAAVDEWGATVSYAPAPVDRWLVTWAYLVGGSNGAQIRGSILNSDGTFYKSSFLVDDRANADFYPVVAYDGVKWHVSWANLLIASTATPITIPGRFVSIDGIPGAAADVQTTAAIGQIPTSETFANGRYVIGWTAGTGASSQLFARTMDTGGALSPIVAVASQGTSVRSFQVVPGPSNKLLLVWSTGSVVQGRLADANLNFLTAPISITAGAECSAAYSATTGKWLVVAGGSSLFGVLVDLSGAVSGAELLASGAASGTLAPRVAWNSATNEMLAIYNVFPAPGSIQNLRAVRYAMPPAQDGTPPSVSITAPANGATVSAGVTATVNATDNVGVTRVEFLAGGVTFATLTTAPYVALWNSLTVNNGPITLQVKAYDAAGNVGTTSISVTVLNLAPPPSPPSGPTCTNSDVQGLLSHVPVAATSHIYVTGPYPGGAVMVEDVADVSSSAYAPVTLQAGSSGSPADFCLYWIDDDTDPRVPPNQHFLSKKLQHPVRFAWTRLGDTTQYQVVSARNSMTVRLAGGAAPQPYTIVTDATVSGVPVTFGLGEFAAEPIVAVKLAPQAVPPSQATGCLHEALVIDGGDKKTYITGNIASAAADDAEFMAAWLKLHDYRVKRISQYWGNSHPGYANAQQRNTFNRNIDSFVNLFANTRTSAGCYHHEFFLYVSSHGGLSGFDLYDTGGSGQYQTIRYSDLFARLNNFPTDFLHNTTVYVMFDACYSGGAMGSARTRFTVQPANPGHHAFQVLTCADAYHTCAAGHFLFSDSATEDFKKDSRTMTTGFGAMVQGAFGENPQRLRLPDRADAYLYDLDPFRR